MQRRISALIMVISFATLFACIFEGFAQQRPQAPNVLRFDRGWWGRVSRAEQEGFIYGYMDCRQIPDAIHASIVDYRIAVSDSMKHHTDQDPDAVTTAIEHTARTIKRRSTRGAETYKGPHGFMNGGWWGEYDGEWPSALAEQDRGYLEGYMTCAAPPVNVQTLRRYQDAINRYYAPGNHEDEYVADLVKRLLSGARLGK